MLALLDLIHYIIFGSHCHMREVFRILCNTVDLREPTKGCQKIIFSCFLRQNSLNKLGNKSMGNPQVKPAPFPTSHSCLPGPWPLLEILPFLDCMESGPGPSGPDPTGRSECPVMSTEVIRGQSSPIFAFAKTRRNKRALSRQPANRS